MSRTWARTTLAVLAAALLAPPTDGAIIAVPAAAPAAKSTPGPAATRANDPVAEAQFWLIRAARAAASLPHPDDRFDAYAELAGLYARAGDRANFERTVANLRAVDPKLTRTGPRAQGYAKVAVAYLQLDGRKALARWISYCLERAGTQQARSIRFALSAALADAGRF